MRFFFLWNGREFMKQKEKTTGTALRRNKRTA
jgi:hypothetical protein